MMVVRVICVMNEDVGQQHTQSVGDYIIAVGEKFVHSLTDHFMTGNCLLCYWQILQVHCTLLRSVVLHGANVAV